MKYYVTERVHFFGIELTSTPQLHRRGSSNVAWRDSNFKFNGTQVRANSIFYYFDCFAHQLFFLVNVQSMMICGITSLGGKEAIARNLFQDKIAFSFPGY